MERGPLLLLYVSPGNFAVSLFLHFPTIAHALFFRHREERAAAPAPLPLPSLPGPLLSHHVARTPDRVPDAAIWDLRTRRNCNAMILLFFPIGVEFRQHGGAQDTSSKTRRRLPGTVGARCDASGVLDRRKQDQRQESPGVRGGNDTTGNKTPSAAGSTARRFLWMENVGGLGRAWEEGGETVTVSRATVCPAFLEYLVISGRGCARFHRASS